PFLTIAIAACAPTAKRASESPVTRNVSADSLVLQRTRCFGYCPAYRVTVTASGLISYQNENPRDTAPDAVSSTSPSALRYLAARAQAIGFFELPPEIASDSELCPRRATDMPTAIVTIYAPDSTKRVSDYHGCFVGRDSSMPTRLAKLRAFEAEIDSVLGSARWVNRAQSR
ncbi:MAG: DUF6438 domain-containing protein, partial [Gemmatimonadota bacterium]|nr:DUF6438 domain-containing protein [Gemmatimonadota bacterium]